MRSAPSRSKFSATMECSTASRAHVVDRGIWPYEFMFTLGLIIGGGTSQIQKNIISERGLGMPKGS